MIGFVALATVLLVASLPAAVTHGQTPRSDTVVVNIAALYYGLGELRWEHHLGSRNALQAVVAAGPGGIGAGFADLWLGKVGAQYRYYFAGGFDEGLAFAVELAALHMFDDVHQRQGLALSPRGVYKLATSHGATAELQIGGALVGRTGVDGAGWTVAPQWKFQASIAAAIGWSF